MELMNANAQVVPVSVWSYPITNVATHQSTSKCAHPVIAADDAPVDARRWLIVLEPVQRITATCTLGPKVLHFRHALSSTYKMV